jgi:hypothetical protein
MHFWKVKLQQSGMNAGRDPSTNVRSPFRSLTLMRKDAEWCEEPVAIVIRRAALCDPLRRCLGRCPTRSAPWRAVDILGHLLALRVIPTKSATALRSLAEPKPSRRPLTRESFWPMFIKAVAAKTSQKPPERTASRALKVVRPPEAKRGFVLSPR